MGGSSGGNFFSNPIKGISDAFPGGGTIYDLVNGKNPFNDPSALIPGYGIVNNLTGGKLPDSFTSGNKQQTPQLPGVSDPNYAGDATAIQNLIKQLNPLYQQESKGISDLYGQQASQENQLIDKQTQDMIKNLTTGTQGEGLREKYNNLGLLNSGAFNEGLAQQFAPIQQQAEEAVLQQGQNKFNDLRNILGEQIGTNVGLNTAGLQREFGLEDWFRNAQQQQKLAQLGVNTETSLANQQGQNQLLSSLIGAGGTLGGAALLK